MWGLLRFRGELLWAAAAVPTPAWGGWAASAVPTEPQCPGPALLQPVGVDLAQHSQQVPPHHCAGTRQRPEILPLPFMPGAWHLDSDRDATGDYLSETPTYFGLVLIPLSLQKLVNSDLAEEGVSEEAEFSNIVLENWDKILE